MADLDRRPDVAAARVIRLEQLLPWLPAVSMTAEGASLAAKELAVDGEITPAGIALRQHLEDDTDRLTTTVWRLLGEDASRDFARDFEPPCELLLGRVDETAGKNYQPASRIKAKHSSR